jgi:deoxyhypusine synthase
LIVTIPSHLTMGFSSDIPSSASAAILKPSEPMSDFAVSVEGPKFDEQMTLQKLLDSYKRIGFQANSLGKAIDIVNKMVSLSCTLNSERWQLMYTANVETI